MTAPSVRVSWRSGVLAFGCPGVWVPWRSGDGARAPRRARSGFAARLAPARAALRQAEAHQQRRHADGCAEAFHDGHAELLLQPVGLDVDGALADAHRDDHLGP